MSEMIGGKSEQEQSAEMLQQILEVMPSDIPTMKTLYNTHLQMGSLEPALEMLVRIEKVATSMKDDAAISFVLEQYAAAENASPEFKEQMVRLRETQGVTGSVAAASESTLPEEIGATSLESEMSLAWELLQDEQLTQEEYSEVVGDLTEMMSKDVGVPVTLLHVLNDRNFSRFERLMAHLSEKANVPILSLESFEENEEAEKALSIEFSSTRGVLSFGFVGEDLLVAVLNPFDHKLLSEATQRSGRTCHAFLVSPYEYDKRLNERKKAIRENEKEEE